MKPGGRDFAGAVVDQLDVGALGQGLGEQRFDELVEVTCLSLRRLSWLSLPSRVRMWSCLSS